MDASTYWNDFYKPYYTNTANTTAKIMKMKFLNNTFSAGPYYSPPPKTEPKVPGVDCLF